MEIDILTKRDLDEFRRKLIEDLTAIITSHKEEPERKYLRSREVRKLLGGISNGTLQSLRVKGLLNPTKIEGVFYYKCSEVTDLLNAGSGI